MEPPALAAPAENLDPPAQIEPQEQEEEFKPVIMTFYAPDTSDEQPEIPPVTARFATLPEPRHPVRLVSSSPDESSDSSSGYSSSDLSFLERAIARGHHVTAETYKEELEAKISLLEAVRMDRSSVGMKNEHGDLNSYAIESQ
ncbi:hypothetical protein B9Z55_028684 [Caenorhabditis nigoni]|uniref:Uncharacterized protein n=1 Tax=Caenorhabditis nigoni TaxID=1611254 RepID=A0A2G5SAG4_9PELO|nr:hypothetical protein B9Z55_028684 [Caenorhabditis nigoni]